MTGSEATVRALTVLLQAAIALVLTASVMPLVLVTVPETRGQALGLSVAGALALLSFAAVWLVWPRKRR